MASNITLSNINNSIQYYSFVCTLKWFQVLLSNTNNSIEYSSLVCSPFNGFKYNKWYNSAIWTIDGALTGTTTVCLRWPEINGNVSDDQRLMEMKRF